MHPKLSRIFISLLAGLILAWSITACGAQTTPVPDTPTPTPIVIITSTLPPTQTPIPSVTPVPPTPTVLVAPVEGQTISQLNVRSAPSAESNLLGSLPPGTAIQIVGKDPTSGWWLIVYPQSPNGTGWVTAQFVQASNTQNVPVISAESQATGSGSGAGNDPQTGAGPTAEPGSAESPSTSTLTFATAYPDGDSPQSPAVSITLSKASVRTFNYSSDISSPEGDPEDWLQFTLDGQFGQQKTAAVTITCSGGSPLNVELIQNNTLLQGWNDIVCGQPSQLQLYLFAGSPYYLRLTPAQGSNPVNYVAYTVIVQLTQ